MLVPSQVPLCHFFFFNDTATTEIYTLSLHDALPISTHARRSAAGGVRDGARSVPPAAGRRGRRHGAHDEVGHGDRKSTRLNSSHGYISYAVFCLKKKNDAIAELEHLAPFRACSWCAM